MILINPYHEILDKTENVLEKIELAGRTCYKSESKITPGSAKDFVKRVIDSGHHSVIEHVNISVKFVCDRGVTHEIVRHRLASYSQESTRYCDYSKDKFGNQVTFILPPWIKNDDIVPGTFMHAPIKWDVPFDANQTWFCSMLDHECQYLGLLEAGWIAQQARSVLPNSLKTEIVMTANVREWRHVLTLRTSLKAHPQIRQIMIPLLEEFKEKIPVIFDDITVKEGWV